MLSYIRTFAIHTFVIVFIFSPTVTPAARADVNGAAGLLSAARFVRQRRGGGIQGRVQDQRQPDGRTQSGNGRRPRKNRLVLTRLRSNSVKLDEERGNT